MYGCGSFSQEASHLNRNEATLQWGALMLDNLSATERAIEAARWSGFFETGGLVGWRYGIFMAMRELFSDTLEI